MALPFPTPPSLSPAFSMSQCTAADVDDLAEVYYVSFQMDPRNTFWWPDDKEAMLVWMKRRIRKKMADRSTRHFKVTDVKNGDIVAFSRWDIPEGHGIALGEYVEEDAATVDVSRIVTEGTGDATRREDLLPMSSAPVDATTTHTVDIPQGARPELCLKFFNELRDMSEKQKAKAMLGLSLLCTAPNYHRRGAAKAMMLPMFDLADARGLKVYLEATPDGKPVYEKLGFREIDQLTFDLKMLTGKSEGIYKIAIMVREPNPVRLGT
ncbi:acyl-CoA N-acyltransferase [Annulohypoxylon moriforme]|nr:acyl-CoA N-acyltransferase [Annulohypoxylon moriforme]